MTTLRKYSSSTIISTIFDIILIIQVLQTIRSSLLSSSSSSYVNTITTPTIYTSTNITPMALLTVQQNLPSKVEQDQVSEVEVVILCVEDKPYGQTFNMLLTIAAARSVAYEWSLNHTTNTITTTNTTQVYYKIGFGPYFSDFIKATLESPEDIVLYHYHHLPITNDTSSTNDKCHFQWKAMDLFYNFFQMDWNVDSRIQLVQSLIPKRAIRELARSYLQQQQIHRANPNSRNTTTAAILTTVHRRNFEKSCLVRSQNRDKVLCLDLSTGNRRNTTESLSNHELSDLCQLNYPMIQKDLKITKLNQKDYIVLLCSDRQVPKYDQTFPHLVNIEPEMLNTAAVAADDDHDDLLGNHTNHTINKHSKTIMMMTEAWMMTLSDIHYGIPMSTVDLVVYIWRNSPLLFMLDDTNEKIQPQHQREMRPLSCYGPSRPM